MMCAIISHWLKRNYWNKIDFKTCKIVTVKAPRKGTAGAGRDAQKKIGRECKLIAEMIVSR